MEVGLDANMLDEQMYQMMLPGGADRVQREIRHRQALSLRKFFQS